MELYRKKGVKRAENIGYRPFCNTRSRGANRNPKSRNAEIVRNRGAESEPESPGVVATSQESESGSESVKLPRLRLRNVLFKCVI